VKGVNCSDPPRSYMSRAGQQVEPWVKAVQSHLHSGLTQCLQSIEGLHPHLNKSNQSHELNTRACHLV